MKNIFRLSALLPARLLLGWLAAPILSGLSPIISGLISLSECYAQSGWFWQNPLPQGNLLESVSFIPQSGTNTGTAVGWAGTILRTTNGGALWTSQSSGTTMELYGVFFIPQSGTNTGTAVGWAGTILRTTTGGRGLG